MKHAIQAALALLAPWVMPCAFGQTVSSSVRGVILDPTGAVVPAAQCSLTNQATGLASRTTSASDGAFNFPAVAAGSYTLAVQAAGFQRFDLKDIIVTASEIRTLPDVRLHIGDSREIVSVTAEGAPIQLASAEKSGLIAGDQINRIAVKGRDFMSLMVTIPGVIDEFTQRREATSPDALRGTHINGARETQKNTTLDGVMNMDIGANATFGVQPNMDAIAEIKILTSNYQAEFGRNSGGVISLITKSGTQAFHGSAYSFYRHESLNANNFFNNRTGTSKAPYRYRISGYSIGGPIYVPKKLNAEKNKLFFFFSQEFIGRRVDYGTRFANMPTQQERGGDFSRSFDVAGNLVAVRDPSRGAPFPGNLIPASRINGLGKSILGFYPAPNYTDPDPRNLYRWNYRSVYSGEYPKRDDVLRIDFSPWQSLQIYYRLVHDTDSQNIPYGYWANGQINYLLTPIKYGVPGKAQAVSITKTFSPTLINEFKFGKGRTHLTFDGLDKSVLSRSLMGNPPEWFRENQPNVSYIPNVSFGTQQPLNAVNSNLGDVPYENYNDNYSFIESITKILGRHTIKAGVYIERSNQYVNNGAVAQAYRGAFSFARNVNNPFDTNHGFANALLGAVESYTESTARADGDYWFWNTEWYVQDNWRVSKRLTLDLGMRFYHNPPMEDLNGNIATFDPSRFVLSKAPTLYYPGTGANGARVAVDPTTGKQAAAPLIGQYVTGSGDTANGMARGGLEGYPKGLYTLPWLAFGPRVGLALDVFGNGRTAIRAGFGMFKDRPQGNITYFTNGKPPVVYSPTLHYGTLDTYAQSAGVIGPSAVVSLLGRAKLPSTMNFSAGFQQQIRNTTVDVAYVGALSRHLSQSREINGISMYGRFDPANADPTLKGPPLPDNFFRPFRGYGSIKAYEFMGTSSYNSLQVSVNRRYTRGLQFGLAYTFSKTLGLGANEMSELSAYFAPRERNYGPLPYDRTHVFVVNYMYDLPSPGARLGFRPAGWVLDNWQVSGITSLISGTPFTPGFGTADGADITGSAEGARISVSGDPHLPKGERTFYRNFKTEVFQRTPLRSFGNAGIGLLRGPGLNNWDIALSKRFPLFADHRFLQFRAEFFNAWNHTQFSSLYTGTRFDATGKQLDPNFGAYSSARDPRIVQFSLKAVF